MSDTDTDDKKKIWQIFPDVDEPEYPYGIGKERPLVDIVGLLLCILPIVGFGGISGAISHARANTENRYGHASRSVREAKIGIVAHVIYLISLLSWWVIVS